MRMTVPRERIAEIEQRVQEMCAPRTPCVCAVAPEIRAEWDALWAERAEHQAAK
jgi:hypothetical protein